jgi:hypothetical protein
MQGLPGCYRKYLRSVTGPASLQFAYLTQRQGQRGEVFGIGNIAKLPDLQHGFALLVALDIAEPGNKELLRHVETDHTGGSYFVFLPLEDFGNDSATLNLTNLIV